MDRVRFGRALGGGARNAARAIMQAADAASSPAPPVPTPISSALPARRTVVERKTAAGIAQVRTTSGGIRRGSKRFGEAVWGPVVKVSGIVWLEVTGVLFSLFAITAAVYLWQHRADIHASGSPRQNLFFAVGMLALFGFFTVSSFVRARQRSRR